MIVVNSYSICLIFAFSALWAVTYVIPQNFASFSTHPDKLDQSISSMNLMLWEVSARPEMKSERFAVF